MYIHNVRYGFATNSSSSHSIILLNDGETTHDNLDYQEFGWDFFTAASERAKREYMGQVVKCAFMQMHGLTAKDAATVASEWAGTYIDPEGYIDHQSVISLPCDQERWHGPRIMRQFFDDLLRFVLRPNIVIGGGNDNDDDVHPLIASGRGKNILRRNHWDDEELGSIGLRLLLEHGTSDDLRARYDEHGKFWTLFSVHSGTKIRLSFGDADTEKSEVPELVDVKITDRCEERCSYCYQGSTPEGEHAVDKDVASLAEALGELKTFEVAVGGGEPTLHPNFIPILKHFRDNGVKANFSTRDADWVAENWKKIKGIVGAVGISVDSGHGLVAKLSHLHKARMDGLKVTVHVVVGVCSDDELADIIEICQMFGVTLLLLGWKNSHRGERGPRYPDIDLEKVLDRFKGKPYKRGEEIYTPWKGPKIAFDTVLVQQMEKWLEANSNRWAFTTREGAHSMYIDCVSGKMGRSSYEVDNLVSLTPNCDVRYLKNTLAEHIREYFSTL